MKKIQNIIIGFFAVMGFIIFTTSLSSKSDSIYVPHNDDGVLNTQTGMIYNYSYYSVNLLKGGTTVHEFMEVDNINKSVKRDTLHFSDTDKDMFGRREYFISK